MPERIDVAVVGGGPAGLATSCELTRGGVEHVVLERGRVGEMWRGRWDSFCLVTPNWTVQLPGLDGAASPRRLRRRRPRRLHPRDEIVAFLERYAFGIRAPVRTGVEVPRSRSRAAQASCSRRARARCTPARSWSRPGVPAAAPSGGGCEPARRPLAIDAEAYRDPGELSAGRVLVVGNGQTGCQIAEELAEAGRDVVLSCGRAPWDLRRFGGRDLLWWLVETGFLEARVDSLPAPEARLAANITATGRGGGHDLHLRTLRAAGVTLAGRFLGAENGRARFAPDMAESVAWGDGRYRQFSELVARLVRERGLSDPELPEPEPFDATAPEEVELAGFGAVVFAGGFRPDYGRWIHVPGAFDALAFPVHADGASLAVRGLFFVGVHFLRKRKSSLLYGVGEDAALVAAAIAGAYSSARGSNAGKISGSRRTR